MYRIEDHEYFQKKRGNIFAGFSTSCHYIGVDISNPPLEGETIFGYIVNTMIDHDLATEGTNAPGTIV